jgi:hypothetical protein
MRSRVAPRPVVGAICPSSASAAFSQLHPAIGSIRCPAIGVMGPSHVQGSGEWLQGPHGRGPAASDGANALAR